MEPSFSPDAGFPGKPLQPRLLFLQEPPGAGHTGGQKIHHRFVREAAEFAQLIYPDAASLAPPGGNWWGRMVGRFRHARHLAASLARQKPDAIFMDIYWFRSYGLALLQVDRRIPLILCVQSVEALVAGDATEQKFSPWFYIRSPVRRRWYAYLTGKLFRRARRVLAMGPWLTQFLHTLGCPTDKTVTTGSGGELTASTRLNPMPEDRELRWMATGYVDPYKGAHRLIEALALLPPAKRPVIDWYGQTEHNQAYFSWCRSLLHSLGLQDNIRFHGWVDREQMQRVWETHDILVGTAPHEGYGLAFCEALTQGLFLLGPRGSTAGEFIVGPENGLCFDAGAPSSLAAAMLQAPTAAARHSKASRRQATTGVLTRHLALPSVAQALRAALGW